MTTNTDTNTPSKSANTPSTNTPRKSCTSTNTPSKSSAVELDPNSEHFNARNLTISQIVQILGKWDVDLPVKKERKEYYVNLLNDNLSYIIKRSKNEKSADYAKAARISNTNKPSPNTIQRTPLSENIAPINKMEEKNIENSKATPSSVSVQSNRRAVSMLLPEESVRSSKRPASDQEEVDENPMIIPSPATPSSFSSVNPFQSPGLSSTHAQKSINRKPKKIFSTDTAVVADINGNIPIDFSKSKDPPSFASEEKVLKSPTERQSLGMENLTPKPQSPVASINDPLAERIKSESKLSLQERLLKRNKAKRQSKKNILSNSIIAFSILLSIFIAHYVITDYPSLQYCPSSSDSRLSNKQIYSFMPSCVPCPTDTMCSSHSVTGCTGTDQILKYSWIARIIPPSFLPFPFNQPSCQYDTQRIMQQSKKVRQVEHLIKVLDQIVREYVGKAQCESKKNFPSFIFSPHSPFRVLGMPLAASKNELQNLIGKKWNQDTFDEYWSLVIDGIAKGGHPLSMVVDEASQHRLFHSSNPAIQSFSCSAKKAIWKWMIENSLTLIVGGFSILFGVYGYISYTTRAFETLVVTSLVDDVIIAVHAENDNHLREPALHPIPGLAISQLKDHFLPSSTEFYLPPTLAEPKEESAPKESSSAKQIDSQLLYRESVLDNHGRRVWYVAEPSRSNIWKRVTAAVSKNSNIRETTAHIKGESHLVWKWVGSNALSPLKKRLRIF